MTGCPVPAGQPISRVSRPGNARDVLGLRWSRPSNVSAGAGRRSTLAGFRLRIRAGARFARTVRVMTYPFVTLIAEPPDGASAAPWHQVVTGVFGGQLSPSGWLVRVAPLPTDSSPRGRGSARPLSYPQCENELSSGFRTVKSFDARSSSSRPDPVGGTLCTRQLLSDIRIQHVDHLFARHAPQLGSLGDSAWPGLPGAALTGVPVAPPRHRLLEPVVRERYSWAR